MIEMIDNTSIELGTTYSEDNDTGALLAGLRVIARVRGVGDMADRVGMTRQGLQKALSDEGNPRFSNITSIVQAMGYRLVPQKLPQSQASL